MDRNNPGGASSSSTSDSASQRYLATYFCRRCPGVELRDEEREAHRAQHIEEDLEREVTRQTRSKKRATDDRSAKKPGPKSKTQRRSPSPTVSSLFSPAEKGRQLRARPNASPRGGDGGGGTSGNQAAAPTARRMGPGEAERLERARVLHFKHAPALNKKFLGA